MVENALDSPKKIVGLFIGSGLSFSDTAVRLATEELPCITFRRLDRLADLFGLAPPVTSDVRLIIVDEGMLDYLQQALPKLATKLPHSRLVLAYRDRSTALRLIADIAQYPGSEQIGFLPMRVEIDHWLSALRLLACGERYMSADLIDAAHRQHDQVASTLSPMDGVSLTSRECEVLSSAAEGKQNKHIAKDLGLSEHTIKLHMHHVMAKLGVSNRTEATLWYLTHKPRPNFRRQ